MSKLNARNTFLLVLAACVLIALAWWSLYFQTRQQQIADLHSQLDSANQTLALYQQASAGLPALRTEVAGLQVKRDVFLQALPPRASIGTVVSAIRQNVASTGDDLQSVVIGNASPDSSLPAGVQPITLNLQVSGRFQPTFQLIRAMETMGRFSNLSSLNLTMPTADSLDPKLTSSMGVTIYTYDAAKAPATGSGAAGLPQAPAAPATETPGGIR
ncbi:type 4a pilus biogenesis protein PilO [Deinococcus sonorensis]|uniref:Type 4a pilus biogenesis protein PilO n=2 Tax=Deinococcus sonorensis TaxID=309891 RepID=A0AAU7U8G0_9DEIO